MEVKKKINREFFFYISLMLQIFYVVRIITINSYVNSEVYVLIILVCSSISIYMSRLNRRELYIFLFLLACAFIHFIKTFDTNLLRMVLLVFSGKGINTENFKKKIAMIYPGVLVGVWILSFFFGFNHVVLEGVWRVSKGWETRYTLGFDGPTRMMFIWLCCIVSMQLVTKKTNIYRDFVLFFITVYLYRLSVSYTGIITVFIALVMPYILNFVVKSGKSFLLKYIINCSLGLVLVLTGLATIIDISRTRFGLWLNGRTYYLHYLFSNGIYPSLFGDNFKINVVGLDNSYFYNLYLLGMIPMACMFFAIIRLGKIYYLKKDIMGISATVSFILVAYATQTFEYPFLNYFLFLIIENWKYIMNPLDKRMKYVKMEDRLIEKNGKEKKLRIIIGREKS